MIIVQKGNVQLQVADELEKEYLDNDYVVVDEKGKVIKTAEFTGSQDPKEIKAMKKKLDEALASKKTLEDDLAVAEAANATLAVEIDTLKKELDEAKAQLEKALAK